VGLLANDKLVMTLMIILVVDVLLLFGQIGSNSIANEYGLENNDSALFDLDKSFIQQFDQGDYVVVTNSSGVIPEATDSVSTETGNLFTDSVKSLTSWFSKTTGSVVTGWDYFTNFLGGPTHYLGNLGAPIIFVFGFGALWYGLTLLLLILLIFNR
jgi:hypothetical protein